MRSMSGAALPQHSAVSLLLTVVGTNTQEATPPRTEAGEACMKNNQYLPESRRLSAMCGGGAALTHRLPGGADFICLGKLNVVVHRELERMRPQPQRLNLALTFVIDPSFDQLRSENIALQQKLVVVFQRVQRVIE